jgi:uncharacterized membrane protein (UPF0127 family)
MRHLRICTSEGISLASKVAVASTFKARFIGLLSRSWLDDEEGLWLEPGGSVHTLGMRFAIDVLFLGADLKVLKVTPRLAPGRLALAPRGTRYVLELPADQARRRGVNVGMELVAGGLKC